jgi:hypothetical protein
MNILKSTISGIVVFIFVVKTYSQVQTYRTKELNISSASIDGITDDNNLIINVADKNANYICLFKNGALIQKRPIAGAELRLLGTLEKGNLVNVFMSSKSSVDRREGVLTFYLDNSKPPTYKSAVTEGRLISSYIHDEGFHKLTYYKKDNLLELETYYMDQLASKKTIIVSAELSKEIEKKTFSFINPKLIDFSILGSNDKLFISNDRLILISNHEESPKFHPELTRIILDFNEIKVNTMTVKLPLSPRSKHSTFLYDNKLFTWGLNYDYFSLSILTLDSLQVIKNLVTFKNSQSIDLKSTPIYYATGAQQNDKSWEWRDPSIKKINEDEVSDIIKQFMKGSLALSVSKSEENIRLIFGSYQGEVGPSRNMIWTTVPGQIIKTTLGTSTTSPTVRTSTSAIQGMVERRRYFYGFLQKSNFTSIKISELDSTLKENKLDRRMTEVFESEKIGGMASILSTDRGYVVYILKKEKELVIEEIL